MKEFLEELADLLENHGVTVHAAYSKEGTTIELCKENDFRSCVFFDSKITTKEIRKVIKNLNKKKDEKQL